MCRRWNDSLLQFHACMSHVYVYDAAQNSHIIDPSVVIFYVIETTHFKCHNSLNSFHSLKPLNLFIDISNLLSCSTISKRRYFSIFSNRSICSIYLKLLDPLNLLKPLDLIHAVYPIRPSPRLVMGE